MLEESFNNDVEAVEERQSFRQGKFRFLEVVIKQVDRIIFRSGEIGVGEVGLEKPAFLEVRILKGPVVHIGLNEINLFGLAINNLDFRHF